MTRIAVVSDVHIGNHNVFGGSTSSGLNARCRAVLDVLARSLSLAESRGCDAWLCAGDLLDSDKASPQIVSSVLELFADHAKLRKYLLLGNHEKHSDDVNDHSLAPFGALSHVMVVDTPRVVRIGDTALHMVPFLSKTRVELVPTLRRLAAESTVFGAGRFARIAVIHAGVVTEDTPPYLRDASDAIEADELFDAMDRAGFDHLYAGNWHNPMRVERYDAHADVLRTIEQVGTLAPTGFDNLGLDYGVVSFYDAGAPQPSTRVVLEGPRFVKVGATTLEEAQLLFDGIPPGTYVKLTVPVALLTQARKLARDVEVLNGFGGVSVSHDKKALAAQRQAAAQAAAQSVKTAGPVEAVAAYVKAMPLDPSVSRAEVTALVMRCVDG